ncbi:MAG: hypothetical protein ACLUUL_07470 [Gemmiger sp.]
MRPDPNGTRRGLSAGRRRGLALLALALCLALPFAAFAGWDGWLFTHPLPARAEDPRDLSAAGRADPTACLLYAADRLLGVPSAGPGPADGWSASEDPAALADAAGEAREILTRMEAPACWTAPLLADLAGRPAARRPRQPDPPPAPWPTPPRAGCGGCRCTTAPASWPCSGPPAGCRST